VCVCVDLNYLSVGKGACLCDRPRLRSLKQCVTLPNLHFLDHISLHYIQIYCYIILRNVISFRISLYPNILMYEYDE
jgi:hypothetical protein